MNRPLLGVVLVIAAVGGAAILYCGLQKMRPEPQLPVAPPAAGLPPPQADTQPSVRYPVRTEQAPLPPLDDSDAAIRQAILRLLGDESAGALLNPQGLVRRIVATVDNLPRKKVPLRLMPVKPAGGSFLASDEGNGADIAPQNPARYSRYVGMATAIDTRKLVAVYVYFYPLFQQAYRELGYPGGEFNDRLVDVIDNLLVTPDIREPVRVVRPKVFYEFAEPDLEALPAGQKILIRIGTANASRIKAKLREIRGELTGQAPGPGEEAHKEKP